MTDDTNRTFGRREVLGLLGTAGVASLAGCGGLDGEPTVTPEPAPSFTDSPPETAEEFDPNTRRGITFDRVVNAVDDLGWDPNGDEPIDDSLDENLRSGTLIEVPPGTYLVEEQHTVEDATSWGIVGTGESRRDTQITLPAGVSFRWLSVSGGRDILIENFTMQQGPKFDRAIGMSFSIEDNLRLYNVEKAGSNPRQNSESGAKSTLVLHVTDPDGIAEVNTLVRKGPQDFAYYPGNAIPVFTGDGHEGTVYYRNLHIENGGEHGIYASKGAGDVRVEGGLFKNNLGDGVRISGEGSWVKGATVVIDENNRTRGNRGDWNQARGIHLQSGDFGFTGGLVEDCTIIARSSPRTEALLMVEHNQGGCTIRNCRFYNDTGYRTIVVDTPGSRSQVPAKPWDVTFENIQISGRATDGVAMLINGRPNSRISNVNIDLPGTGIDGIVLNNSAGTLIENASIVTGEYPLRVSSNTQSADCLVTLRNLHRLESKLLTDTETQQLVSSLSDTICLGDATNTSQTLTVVSATDGNLYGTVTVAEEQPVNRLLTGR